MNIFSFKHIHFTGIKGVGMTALVLCIKDLGIKVTGSDIAEEFVTDETLRKNKISWRQGFSRKNLVPKPDLVVTTGAHGGLKNPEVLAAKKMGIQVLTQGEALAEISKEKQTIAVAGVGGKTTTSAMIAHILTKTGKYPSFAIGAANINPLGNPGRYTKGEYFVTEADEFVVSPGVNNTPKFLLLNPKVLVITNIEHDHPDIYPTIESTKQAFKKLIQKIPPDGLLLLSADNPNNLEVLKAARCRVQTYGFSEKSDWKIKKHEFKERETHFILLNSQTVGVSLKIPGEFNILNSTAALATVNFLGVDIKTAIKALESFGGVRRRAEKMGERHGILFYDDYAYHPTEIKATLKAFRQWYPKRKIIAIFQPHTYSRTKTLLWEFAKAFGDANKVFIVDIYGSRETDTLGINSEILASETQKYHKDVQYTGSLENTAKAVNNEGKKGDVVITMGAGNIFHIYKKLL